MLPLGSVVRLFGSIPEAKLLIIGRLPSYTKNGIEGYCDYVACPHALGATEEQFFYFNEENIEEIFFKGYIDSIEIEFNKINENAKENLKLPKIKVW